MSSTTANVVATERLYYRDSFLYEFDATVVDVLERGGRTAVVLDRSVFYPTSGGQIFDTGKLIATGAEARVAEVAEEEDGRILHFVEGAAPQKGSAVHGQVDADRRRDHMQQHSGQHILSAAFVRLFEMPTVSFHMGAETCTIDLDTKSLSDKQLFRAEHLANQVVTEDRPVEIRSVTLDEARALGIRKLPPVEREKLRLIEIRDFDLTACGGTHVRSTGQVGAILLRKTENVKQGVRVEFVCGGRAVATARRDYTALTEAAGIFSTHIYEVGQQIRKTLDQTKSAQKEERRLLAEIAELNAEKMLAETDTEPAGGFRLISRVYADRDAGYVKLLAQKLTSDASRPAVALLASTSGQPTLIFAQTAGQPFNMGVLMKEATSACGGRGGGSAELAQGGLGDARSVTQALEVALSKLPRQL